MGYLEDFEIKKKPAAPRRWIRPFGFAIVGFILGVAATREYYSRDLAYLVQLKARAKIASVPLLRIEAEEIPQKDPSLMDFKLFLINVGFAPIEDATVVLKPLQQGVELPPADHFQFDPPFPVEIDSRKDIAYVRLKQPLANKPLVIQVTGIANSNGRFQNAEQLMVNVEHMDSSFNYVRRYISYQKSRMPK